MGASLIVKGIRERGGQPWAQALPWMRSPKHIANFAVVLAAIVFYILVSEAVGFAFTAFVTLFVLLVWLRGSRLWASSALISLVAMIAIQQFFGQFLILRVGGAAPGCSGDGSHGHDSVLRPHHNLW